MSASTCVVVPTDHGGSPCQGGSGALVEVIGRGHAPVGHLEARVHIDAPWDHHAAVGVDDLHPAGNDQVLPNLPEGETEMGRERCLVSVYHRLVGDRD